MKKLSTFILIGVMIMGNSFAQKSIISHIDYNNLLASAAFETVSVDGCTVTDVIVKTGETFDHDNGSGKPVNSPFTSILIQSINYCTLEYVYLAESDNYFAAGGNVDGNLTSANMDITMPLFDQVSNTTSNAHIVINWNSTSGMITHQFTNTVFNTKGLHYTEVSHGIYRNADASGSISIAGGDNIIPVAGYFNYIIRGGVDEIINEHPARMAQPDANQNMGMNSVSIYPNPTTDVLHINTANVSQYSVVNMLGSLVTERIVEGTTTDELNIAGFLPGIYFLRLQTSSGQVVEKFVKE